jgi:hypothetical protein
MNNAIGHVKSVLEVELLHWSSLNSQVIMTAMDKVIPAKMHEMIWSKHIHSFSIRNHSSDYWRYCRLLFLRLEPYGSLYCIKLGVDLEGNVCVDDYEWEVIESLYMPMLLTASQKEILP